MTHRSLPRPRNPCGSSGDFNVDQCMHHPKGRYQMQVFVPQGASAKNFPRRYRYDGLYVVEEVRLRERRENSILRTLLQATLETGINGYKVCRFLFRVSLFSLCSNWSHRSVQRLPDQGNIPVLTYEQTLANMKKSKRAQARIIPAESESDGDSDSHSSSHPLPPSRSSSPSVSELAPIRTAPAQRVAGRGQGRGRSSQGGPLARIRKGIAGRRALDVNRLNHIRAIQGAQSSTQAE